MSGQQAIQDAAHNAFEEAYNVLISEGDWKEVKKTETGDTVATKKNANGRPIYRVKAVIDVAPAALIAELAAISKQTQWNKTLTKCDVLSEVSDDVMVTHTITTEGGAGLVSARDFVLAIKK